MHQWRALEPYRVRENGNEDDTSLLGAQSILFSEENNEEGGRNTIDDKQGSADPTTDLRLLDTDPTGDCFGLLGGKPLLARTKTIADVGDLRQLAAGEHFFLALSSSSTLYTWESQASTSSGLSFTTPSVGRGCAIPEQVPWFSPAEKVFRVACGAHHVLALTSSGLYAWGSNLNGQLGLGSHCSPADPNTVEPAPVCLRADCTPVLDVACGDTHSIVLSASGQILTFGCNWEGQLGIDQSQTASAAAVEVTGCAYEPLLVTLPRGPEIRDAVRAYLIAAGPQTTAVVATTGQIFQWGKCVPDGVDGVCGRISRFLPEELKAANKNNDASVSGPVWHSIAIADGLVVLTRHANLNSVMPGV
ncbi:unnamed protein product [Phytophthora lilii]|uniref:Unnamed protein product n=1 Tax=Phytophthora lilii TaxID=2077276 RepID=A0A9W6XHW1_9STRA|nr:unnamed protein product [Phytophthora lilii]